MFSGICCFGVFFVCLFVCLFFAFFWGGWLCFVLFFVVVFLFCFFFFCFFCFCFCFFFFFWGGGGGVVSCLTSQQHNTVYLGRICSDNFTCCHAETEVAYQTYYLTKSQYTDTKPTSPGTDLITTGALQVSHWSINFKIAGMIRPGIILAATTGIKPRVSRSQDGHLNH